MATYSSLQPILTLYGNINTVTLKDKYGINDETGLGPNGSDSYISWTVTIDSISAQSVGDASVFNSSGLNVGGGYTGDDVKIGDFITDVNGAKTYKITSISQKTSSGFTCVLEDVGMAIARTRSDRANTPGEGADIVIYRVNNNNVPLIAPDQTNPISEKFYPRVKSYFSLFEPIQKFTFYPDTTGSLSRGDLVTITGSISGISVYPYRLIPAKEGEPIIGTISEIYGENNVNVRPYNKIITDFEKPELLVDGEIGSIWYLNGTNGGIVTSSDAGTEDRAFFQLSLATATTITGSKSNPTLDETQYNFIINGTEVIAQDAGGGTLNLSSIISSINSFASTTYVSASSLQSGGIIEIQTEDLAGTNGDNGEYGYSSFTPKIFSILSGTTVPQNSTGNYSSAPGKFAITASGYEMEIHPTASSGTVAAGPNNYPIAFASDIGLAINSASAATGADLVVEVISGDIIKLSNSDGSNIEISQISQDQFGKNLVGGNSSTALPTGQFTPSTIENFLTLERADGGVIAVEGDWLGDTQNSSGIHSAIGIPPYLLMLNSSQGGGGADTDWFEGDTYLSASKDVRITGSLNILGDTISTGSTYIQGDLRVDGTASISHFHTLFETSSVIYNSGSTKFGDTLDDLHEITGSVEITGSLSIKDLAEDDTLTEVVVIDRTTGELKYKEETTGSASNIYSSSLADSIEMEEDVGGMPAGTTVGDLTLIESYNDLFDTILFPTGYPTLTAPSISATLSPSGLQIIGTEISSGNLSLTTTFNQGSIDPQYTATSGKRSGLPNTYNYSSPNTAFASSVSSTSLTDTITNTLKYTVIAGANNFSVEVDHDAGVQPKDSKGDDFNSALSAGTVGPTTKTITGVYPVFATTSAIDTLTTQSLVVMTGYAEVDLVAEIFGQSDRQTVLIPTSVGGQAGWGTITIVEFFNTNSGNWEAINLTDWDITSSVTKQIEGSSVSYTEFENKVGYPRGAGKYRFKA